MTDPVRLEHRLEGGRRRYLANLLSAGALRFLAFVLLGTFALVVLGALLARVPEAPYVLAALLVGGIVAGIGLCVVRPLVAAPALKPYALLAEDRFPEALTGASSSALTSSERASGKRSSASSA